MTKLFLSFIIGKEKIREEKRLKKAFVISLAFLLLFSFAFTSCSDPKDQIGGRWETEIEDETLGNVYMVYHFTGEGSIYLEQREGDTIPFSIPFGTWVLKGDQITISSNGEENRFTFSVSRDTLVLKQSGQEDLIFKKV